MNKEERQQRNETRFIWVAIIVSFLLLVFFSYPYIFPCSKFELARVYVIPTKGFGGGYRTEVYCLERRFFLSPETPEILLPP